MLILLVCYSVKVGTKAGSRCQDEEKSHEIGERSENVLINKVLLSEKLSQKRDVINRNAKHRTGGRRKVKSKSKQTDAKGRTIFILTVNKQIWRKQARLRGAMCNRLWSKSLIYQCFEVFNINLIVVNNFKIILKALQMTVKMIISLHLSATKMFWSNDKLVRRFTISMSLIRGNVEINPGPPTKNRYLEIVTFNCNGLGNRQKLKRILTKSNNITDKGGIVMLQETHITDQNQIAFLTKSEYQLNSFSTNSAGVLTLYGKNFKTIYTDKDNTGRQLYTVIQENDQKILLVNVYCPNDHRQSIKFAEQVYCKILEIRNEIPDCYVVLAGDFNSCMNDNDYLNRNRLAAEKELTKFIKSSNTMCDLVDSFTTVNNGTGFTWNRGNCYSRLDYIYVSNELQSKITSSKVDWAFEKSDHAALFTRIKIGNEIVKGPGIVKVCTKILEDRGKTEQIKDELKFLIQQIPIDWDGHTKLEFLKMSIRSTFAKYKGIQRSEDKEQLENLGFELNDIEQLKQRLVVDEGIVDNAKKQAIDKVDAAIRLVKIRMENLRNNISKNADFKSASHWYEYGEKSNKFFLNLNKFRGKQKLISEITNENKQYEGHSEVMGGIRDFYKTLYSKATKNPDQDKDTEFFQNVSRMSEGSKNKMDDSLSIAEMHKALLSCKDSAPGPDGIPYSVYKFLWTQVSPIIKEAWDHSVAIGSLPVSHKESVITILPKEG